MMAAITVTRPTFDARRLGVLALAIAVLAWILAGLLGGYTYLHRYNLYRGFVPLVTPAGVARGTLRTVRFHSAATGRRERYLVYLPPGYAAAARLGVRFPVLYLLHGSPGNLNAFTDIAAADVRSDVLIHQRAMQPMILVMPAGKEGTLNSDTEWANTAAGRWEDDVIDVVRDVDHRFATLADRRHRGIAGNSEGAYAAVNIALHHLGTFSVAESWSGYFTQSAIGPFAGATPAELRVNSPLREIHAVVPEIRRLGLRAWLFQGRLDTHNPAGMERFASTLSAAGAQVKVGFFRGGHDWGLWRRETPRMLVAASRWFAQRPTHRGALSYTGHAPSAARRRRLENIRRRRCLALPAGRHMTRRCLALRRSLGVH